MFVFPVGSCYKCVLLVCFSFCLFLGCWFFVVVAIVAVFTVTYGFQFVFVFCDCVLLFVVERVVC